MTVVDQILGGFAVATQPWNLLFLTVGVLTGSVVGMLPGIGAAAAIALLLPVTFGMDPIPSLIMLAGIYYGVMFGNSTAAILINTPGTSSAAMSTLDGHPMARAGRGGAALAIAAVASFSAGTIGVIALSLFALPLSRFGLQFGPAEYFMLMVFAITSVGALSGRSISKGMIAVFFGLALSTVGVDSQTGRVRHTLGIPELMDGVPFLVVVVGLFAISEVLRNVEKWFKGELKAIPIQGKLWATREEWRRSAMPIARGGVIGFLVGVMPGAGGTIATVISYSVEKRISKTPEQFGKGAPEGLAGPEAANNASTSGAFVPLLTLGIPGSGVTAVLLGAFIMYGLQPGPLLFQSRPDLAWGLINSMYIGNVMLLALNLPLVPLFARLLYTPPGILMAIIVAVASIGIYSISGNVFHLYMMLAFGVVGYVLRRLDVPFAPVILGLVLGRMMEQSFRQAMTISQQDPMIFVSSPITMTLLMMSAASLAVSVYMHRRYEAAELSVKEAQSSGIKNP